MFQIAFNTVTLPKANRYVVLIVHQQQTKRTNISAQWTSNPSFKPVELGQQLQNIELKVCEASSDRKLKIVGTAQIKKEKMRTEDVAFEGELKIEQIVQGNRICVGICNIRIARKIQFEETSMINQLQKQVAQGEDEPKELKGDQFKEDDPQEEDQQIRFEFHCGANFYLGAAFSIQVKWGHSFFKTKSIKDKINPVWNENCCLSGSQSKQILVRVCDQKNNILQGLALGIEHLRVMYPYHLQLKFKEEFMGAVPEIYFTVIRQSFPLFSIMEIPIRFSIRPLGQDTRNTFIMLSMKKQFTFPRFIKIDRRQITSLEKLNKYITGQGQGEEDRIDFVALPVEQQIKNISIFKSYLSKKLYLHVFKVTDMRASFSGGGWSGCKLLEIKQNFETILRKIYYQGEVFTLKKYCEIFNPSNQLQKPEQGQTDAEKWKLMSNNYVLRHKLVNTSKSRIEQLKEAIQSKGKQLVELKKVLREVKSINTTLVNKQKLYEVIKNKKVRLNAKQVGIAQLITALISKQAQLEQHKRINTELTLRMDSLVGVEEDQGDLDRQLVRNAEELLAQQQKIKRMNLMEKGIKKQRQIIGELEKVFEERQMAFRVNEVLKEQSDKLKHIREKKQQKLNNVYAMIKQHGKEGGSYTARIKRAEETLVNLNAQYAKLISF